MDLAEITAEIAAGRLTVVRRPWAGNLQVWFGVAGDAWRLEAGEHLGRLERIVDPEQLPPAITGWLSAPSADDELAVARARATLAEAQRLESELEAGAWIWRDVDAAIAPGGRLGPVRFQIDATGGGDAGGVAIAWLSRASWIFKEIAAAIWLRDSRRLAGQGDAFSPHASPPPPEVAAPLEAALAEVSEALDAVEAGTHLYGTLAEGGGRGFLCAWGRWLRVEVNADGRLDEEALFNPWRLLHDREKVIDAILERRRSGAPQSKAHPLPPELQEDWEALEAAFALPREAIVQRYMDRIRAGGTISGGPTTDQSWTVRWEGGGFTISGYRDDGDGLRPVTDPLPVERLRSMLERYRMFGLHRHPDAEADGG